MRRWGGFLVVAMLAASCDRGPDGPGDLAGSVHSPTPDLGGVVVQVVGAGIDGFSGAGGTRVFWAQQEDPLVYRVIVIGDGTGPLNFTASVQERAGKMPRASVISAVDSENRPKPVTGEYRVRFQR